MPQPHEPGGARLDFPFTPMVIGHGAHSAFDALADPVFVVDVLDRHEPAAFRCSYANRALRVLLGDDGVLESDECLTNNALCLTLAYLESVIDGETVIFEDGLTFPGHVFEMHLAPVFDARRDVVQIVGSAREVTRRVELAEELAFHHTHDPLTGLANREQFHERLHDALLESAHYDSTIAVLLVDLDRFHIVNDSLGHLAGDRLLHQVARRIESALRFGDVVARLGGDEFAIICEDATSVTEVAQLADRLLALVAEGFSAEDCTQVDDVFVHASIGIAIADGPNDTSHRLLRDADVALSNAKSAGDRAVLFDVDIRERVLDRLALEKDLHRALRDDELRVYYQPLVHFDGAEVVGLEALLRWEHPDRGVVGPLDFIPLAEETGLIIPIGAWVLDEVCRQAAHWAKQMPEADPIVVHVNLSAKQLAHPDLVGTVAEAIARNGIAPSMLALEVTETVLMDDPELAATILHALRSLGVRLAVDDFGTGHSSLGYLKQLPVDSLKIDRAFIMDLATNPNDEAIVAAVVALGHALGLEVTAEGIETLEQLEALEALGCDMGQGFYFAKPQPGEIVNALVRHRLRWQRHAQAS